MLCLDLFLFTSIILKYTIINYVLCLLFLGDMTYEIERILCNAEFAWKAYAA